MVDELYHKVVRGISKKATDSVLSFVKSRSPSLYGEWKPPSFVKVHTLLTIYKDLKGFGIDKLIEQVGEDSFDFGLGHTSLLHNIEVIRPILADWADSRLHLGSVREWDAAARFVDRPSSLQACLGL